MARTQRRRGLHDARGETPHEQTGRRLLRRACDGRDGGVDEQLAEVLVVQGDAVGACRAGIGLGYEVAADGDLRGEPDDADADLVGDEVRDGLVDVAGI